MNNCSFCDEINDENNNLFYNTIGKRKSIKTRILYQNTDWIVVPTIGCFTVGYILIVSKTHYLSISSLPDNLFSNFESLLDRCNVFMKKQFNSSYIAFEHGSTSSEYRLSCCIDHMHLHVVPCNENLWDAIVKEYHLNYIKLNNYCDVKKYVNTNNIKSYLLFQDINKEIYIIDTTNNIFPSQFFRQVFSKKLGEDLEWDWRHNYYENNMIQTIQLCQNFRWFE
jgi:diadenosine tetraphosphate (Ap4A) HIT family hydrolase